jgi:integrase
MFMLYTISSDFVNRFYPIFLIFFTENIFMKDIGHDIMERIDSRLKKLGKGRKWLIGDTGVVPLLPEVKALLLDLLSTSPWLDEEADPFIFYSLKPGQPCNEHMFLDGLKRAMKTAHIELKGRNIDFHSFRHYYASRMADVSTPEKVARVTGHKTKAVAEHYQEHITMQVIQELGAESEQVFSNILPKIPG